MKITKLFKTESAHIVRSCSSERCSHSIHGHSAKIEVEFEANSLDNAQMVYDFGLMSGTIKQFIDSLDHCYLLCSKEPEEFKNFIKQNCDRWIELPFNPSAEMLSMFIFGGCRYILDHTQFNNGEDEDVNISAVTYHETDTGRATCNEDDYKNIFLPYCGFIKNCAFSDGIVKDWSVDLINIWFNEEISINKKPENQIDFNNREDIG